MLTVTLLAVGGALALVFQGLQHRGERSTETTSGETAIVNKKSAELSVQPDPQIARIVSGDFETMRQRIEALTRHDSRLKKEEVEAVLDLIQSPVPAGEGVGVWAALVNEAINMLQRQVEFPGRLSETLCEMSANEAIDPLLRDYAIQHLSVSYVREVREKQKNAMVDALWSAAKRSRDESSGTALLALNHIAKRDKINPSARSIIDSEAFAIFLRQEAVNGAAHPGLRLACVHSLIEMQDSQSLALARSLSGDGTQRLMLRKAAIRLLGILGTAEDEKLLNELNAVAVLRPAIAPALQDLSKNKSN